MEDRIDRKKIVLSHNPRYTEINAPLSVGNGNFAFTADVTGLQCFSDLYEEKFNTPLCTLAQWAVHTAQPNKFRFEDLKQIYIQSGDRAFGVPLSPDGQAECWDWLRQNPHKLNLCRLSFLLNGESLRADDISEIHQELNLWEGILYSEFLLKGRHVSVKTCCHPLADAVSVSVKSDLITDGSLCVEIAFPYGSHEKSASDWNHGDAHETCIIDYNEVHTELLRLLDDDKYFCSVAGAEVRRAGKHKFLILSDNYRLEFTCAFSANRTEQIVLYDISRDFSKDAMLSYWTNGGFIDFTACADPRAPELSRRVILSQYLTRVNCAGNYPPQETGLVCNSWYGKAHLEMHYWHAYHFILFGKPQYFERSLWWYKSILKEARALARSQGFLGARWPKMPWPDGKESPSVIAPLLIWQQPHPIHYIDSLYRFYEQTGEREKGLVILEEYKDIIYETADFMASFAYYEKERDRYILTGLIPAQENHSPADALNPAFELEYWRYGLTRAAGMAEILGDVPNKDWLDVAGKLSALPQSDGCYLAHENCPDTYTAFNKDHPSFLYALGMLPGEMVDADVMARSLEKTLASWDYAELWGWDFSAMAMTAAALNKPELALDILLMDSPKNTYTANGHNAQGSRGDLPAYLPGNGGLLTALAMMCRDDVFPKNGQWNVRHEGF